VAGQAASVVDEVAAELGGEALPEGVECVRNPSMHRGASCAKLVENYHDARKPRSAQGVMSLEVIAVLMPFGTLLIVAARYPVCGEPVCLDRSTYQNNYECPLRKGQ